MTTRSSDGTKAEPTLSLESLLTAEEVAFILRLEPETVRKMARKGELPAMRVGRVWRFSPDRLKNWMLKQQSAQIRGI